jgi:replicative DNA helicase
MSAPGLENVEAERGVLGRILADDRSWWDVADRIKPGDFSDNLNARIFAGMANLVSQGRPIMRPVLLSQIGGDRDGIELSAYLAAIAVGAPKAEALPSLVDAVIHASGRRKILDAIEGVKDKVQSAGLDTSLEEIIQDARNHIAAVDDDSPDDAAPFGDLVGKVVKDAHEVLTTDRRAGYRVGLRAWDDMVGTMLPGQLIVIGGETSSGKTALAAQIAISLAQNGVPIHFTSLEMTGAEIAARALGTFSNVSAEKIIDGSVNAAELDRAFEMAGRLQIPLYVDSRPQQTTATLQARLARAQMRRKIVLAVVDHLQYVKPDNARADERVQIRQVVDDLKAIAKRLGIVIILVSHVSRAWDANSIHCAADIRRPMLKDLYGSSAIEKAADVTVFVHRPIWFLERIAPGGRRSEELQADKIRWAGKAELVKAKRRAGKGSGVRECWFDEALTWFRDDPAENNSDGEIF